MAERVLTAIEFAEAIRVSLPTAHKLLRLGTVKAGRAGYHWRIPESSVVEFLHGGSGQSGSEGQTAR
jgi:excisionase family DNA binding protein